MTITAKGMADATSFTPHACSLSAEECYQKLRFVMHLKQVGYSVGRWDRTLWREVESDL